MNNFEDEKQQYKSKKRHHKEKVERIDHIEREGRVIQVLKGKFLVEMSDNQQKLIAQISGRMRQNKIHVLLEDTVTMRFSVLDPHNNGIIIHRK